MKETKMLSNPFIQLYSFSAHKFLLGTPARVKAILTAKSRVVIVVVIVVVVVVVVAAAAIVAH
jgi:hypothetical protein